MDQGARLLYRDGPDGDRTDTRCQTLIWLLRQVSLQHACPDSFPALVFNINQLIFILYEALVIWTKNLFPRVQSFYRCTEKRPISQVIKGKSQTPDFGDKQPLALWAAQWPFCKTVTPKVPYCSTLCYKENTQLPTKRMYSRYSHLVKQERMSAANSESSWIKDCGGQNSQRPRAKLIHNLAKI